MLFEEIKSTVWKWPLPTSNCDQLHQQITVTEYCPHTDNGLLENNILLGSLEYHVPTVQLQVENDSDWHDLILQTVWLLLDAECKGITASNIPSGYRVAHWRRMLLNETNDQAVLKELGNYGEIYQNNLGDILPNRGRNQHCLLSSEGALFSPM